MVNDKLPPPLTEVKPIAIEAAIEASQDWPCPACSIVWSMREGPVPTIAECKAMPNEKGRHCPGPDLSKVNLVPLPPRKVFVQPCFKVCIEVPGQAGGSGVSAMWDRGPSPTGLQFPNELRCGPYFQTEAEARAAAEKYTIYRNALEGVATSKTTKAKPKKR